MTSLEDPDPHALREDDRGLAEVVENARKRAFDRQRRSEAQHLNAHQARRRAASLLKLSRSGDVLGGASFVDPLIEGMVRSAAGRTVLEALAARLVELSDVHGAFYCLYAGNFYAGGGAERAMIGYARAAAQRGLPSLAVFTDDGPRATLPDRSTRFDVLDLAEAAPGWGPAYRQALLQLVLQAFQPSLVHIVNSAAGWSLLESAPPRLLPATHVVASIFSLPISQAGVVGGFAAESLFHAMGRLDAVLSDNARFAAEAPGMLGLTNRRKMFHVVPNASRLEGLLQLEQSISLIKARRESLRSASKMRVVWAGRLDTEKRLDILIQVAEQLGDGCDFEIYGTEVLGGQPFISVLQSLPNVTLRGGFETPLEWDAPGLAHAFLFTSAWEGMPNVLLEAAYLGIPVVASDVGGVAELITPETGALISADAGAEGYSAALRWIRDNPDSAAGKAELLTRRTSQRHSAASMAEALFEVPSYRRLLDHVLMDKAARA